MAGRSEAIDETNPAGSAAGRTTPETVFEKLPGSPANFHLADMCHVDFGMVRHRPSAKRNLLE